MLMENKRIIPAFIKCRNCGKVIRVKDRFHDYFCSDKCAFTYGRCITCGKFIPKSELLEDKYCSHECSVQYRLLTSPISRKGKFLSEELKD